MYQQYFGLAETPFSISPDPRYLFLSDKHREALAHLIYGVGDQGGFVLLTGEVGTGKTTICRCLLQQIPDNADVAFIINPKQSINQLLQSIFKDLGIAYESGLTSKDLIDRLNSYLLEAHARGRNTILIIDEAQNLSTDVLEQLRLLTNLETNEKKLLQLVLLGQPELNELLARDDLRQLAQRVTARYHLSPLSKPEMTEYIEHRLSIAGCRSELFSVAAIRKIYSLSKGVPRLVNLICDRTLLGVYSTNNKQASPAIVAKAAQEIFPAPTRSRWRPAWIALFVASLLIAGSYGVEQYRLILSAAVAPTTASAEKEAGRSAEWLVKLKNQQQSEPSFRRLYALWDKEMQAQSIDDCQQGVLNEYGVYCLQSTASLEALLAYNAPLVLVAAFDNAPRAYMLVKSVEGVTVNIEVGGEEFRILRTELENIRLEKSYLISRIPASYHFPLEPGSSGREVIWLQSLLSHYGEAVAPLVLEGRKKIYRDTAVARDKTEIFYSHSLDFFPIDGSDTYTLALQKTVKSAQLKLGFEATAIVDIPFLSAINQQIHPVDPVLSLPVNI